MEDTEYITSKACDNQPLQAALYNPAPKPTWPCIPWGHHESTNATTYTLQL